MDNFNRIFEKSSLFKDIDKEEIEKIIVDSKAIRKNYIKGEYIFSVGQKTSKAGFILNGSADVIQEDFWGNKNLISSIYEGQCFGESFACAKGVSLNISVVAKEYTQVIFLDLESILNTGHPLFIMNLLSDIAKKNINFSEKLISLGQRSTREKLISYLSLESKRNQSKEFRIPYSRQELADYLFVDRSGLCAELSKMKKEGLLDYNKNYFELRKI